ncbi:hypothetical protein [Afipia carboxidovorans]|uniref:hypothetical protein n=1 Tax=Afipia carboxidovorans TaxID=40137 RepID=UPI003090CBAB|nr:hypothetical protein CRBSH125_05770 [Afipia carboxidovorans]
MTETEAAPAGSEASIQQSETLRGDIRDAVLSEFKHMPNVWPKLGEGDQERLIRRAEDIAGMVVRRAIDIIAERGLPALPIEVGKVTVDGSVCKGAFECYADDEALIRIRHLQGNRAMFVLASPDRFNGEQGQPEAENVGDLAMPKEGERADEANLASIGQGKGRKKKTADDTPPIGSTAPAEDVSDPPFLPAEV